MLKSCNIDTVIFFGLTRFKFTFAVVKRFLAFILSLVVLSQSFVACADVATHSDDNSLAKYETLKATQEHDNPEDACPPFCQCNCCAGFSTNHYIPFYSTLPLTYAEVKTEYPAAPLQHMSLPIWQPPQLV